MIGTSVHGVAVDIGLGADPTLAQRIVASHPDSHRHPRPRHRCRSHRLRLAPTPHRRPRPRPDLVRGVPHHPHERPTAERVHPQRRRLRSRQSSGQLVPSARSRRSHRPPGPHRRTPRKVAGSKHKTRHRALRPARARARQAALPDPVQLLGPALAPAWEPTSRFDRPGRTRPTSRLHQPQVILVTENKDTALFFPQVEDGIVIEGNGNAVTRLAKIPWIRACPPLSTGVTSTPTAS